MPLVISVSQNRIDNDMGIVCELRRNILIENMIEENSKKTRDEENGLYDYEKSSD